MAPPMKWWRSREIKAWCITPPEYQKSAEEVTAGEGDLISTDRQG